MKLEEFLRYMDSQKPVEESSSLFQMFHDLSQEALKITMELNNKYHSPEEIVQIFSELTGSQIDKSFRLFPPFYTDCGKNIKVGKNVFINSSCHFQDQGGIEIANGCLIGHNVTIATLNHELQPNKRGNLHPQKVKIGKNVWIGSNSVILPGVTIGSGAIIGAGSIVTKSIPSNAVAAGNPARIIKQIKSEV